MHGQLVATRLGPLRVKVAGEGPTALLWHSLFVDSTTWIRVEQRLIELVTAFWRNPAETVASHKAEAGVNS